MSKSTPVIDNAQDFTHTGPYNAQTGQYNPLPDDPYESTPTLVSQGSVLVKDGVEGSSTSSIVYDDAHVSLDSSTRILTIKHYILVHPTLYIPIDDILYICPAGRITSRVGIRPWGMGLTGILWARDFKRGGAIIGAMSGFEKSFVVKVKGDRMKSGFSVEDTAKFREAMEEVCSGVMDRSPPADELIKQKD
ncbi:hypothetical protein FRB94_010676 [Tulasnella sp. JGI-2019a]|nr:hypothetical protein FRB94_010676 [Tulasnella sp. JGI-2019a]KAG9011300.1 hypothetical protein FRB93_003102 [Tulasnella sp. JGI-2019a]KAG9037414.1 hypothetical protein FRB95_005703 [Tulasnella sp. JGI-2019a]